VRLAVLDVGSNTIHLAVADMHGTRRGSHKARVPGAQARRSEPRLLVLLGDRDSNRADDKITVGGGGKELPPWGLVPEGTVRGGPIAARGHPGRGPALEIGPGFRRRYYLASSTGGIETVLDLDEQGQQIAHFPWFPGPATPVLSWPLSGE
jgi:hypothetical protein